MNRMEYIQRGLLLNISNSSYAYDEHFINQLECFSRNLDYKYIKEIEELSRQYDLIEAYIENKKDDDYKKRLENIGEKVKQFLKD